MDDGVKQRIIGAFVLLALGVIFVPVFFDRERMEPVDRTSRIPLAPEYSIPDVEEAPVEESDTKQKSQSSQSSQVSASEKALPSPEKELVTPTMPENHSVAADTMFLPKDTSPESPEPVKPQLDKKGVPQSWVIQVASFRFQSHAKQMRDELIQMGYRAYVREVKTTNGKMTRVYVGPKLDKSRLVEAQKVIEKKYSLKAILVRFEP